MGLFAAAAIFFTGKTSLTLWHLLWLLVVHDLVHRLLLSPLLPLLFLLLLLLLSLVFPCNMCVCVCLCLCQEDCISHNWH